MIRCLIGACVLGLAAQSPVQADNYMLELTIWKVDIKDGQLAPTSYKEVMKLVDQKAAKVAYSSAIAAQANSIFKMSANQDGKDEMIRLNVDGELGRKDADKIDGEPEKKGSDKKNGELDKKGVDKKNGEPDKKGVDKKIGEPAKKGGDKKNGELGKKDGDKKLRFEINVLFKMEEKAAKGKSTSIDFTASGDLPEEGQVLSVLQTPQGTFIMTLANKK
jgi:hypothetical protein